MNLNVKDKRILLLGACGVLGRAHAKILLNNGARLIIADRPGSTVIDDSKELDCPGIEIDVSIENDMINGINKCLKFYNGIDGAIYNAALTSEFLTTNEEGFPDFENYPLELWKKAIDVNLTGAFLFCRQIGKSIKPKDSLSIILVSSIYGVVAPDHEIYKNQPFKSFPAYSASKAGIIGLTRWLASWWGKRDIRINSVSPGGVLNNHQEDFVELYSKRVPMGKMADKNDITGIIIYLLSDSSRYCTGQNFIIDGGLTAW